MIRHHILHRTVYRYTEPVLFGMHRLVLRPREGHNVKVVRHLLTVTPTATLFWLNDLYSNHVALAEIQRPAERLEILSDLIIDRLPYTEDEAPKQIQRRSLTPLPIVYPQMELPVVQGFTTPVYPNDQAAVAEWMASLPAPGQNGTAYGMVQHLGRSIFSLIRYRRREEPGVQSPATTLALASGSCRDMAVLMIEACRSLGIASRFVSGYLNTASSVAGRGATHAWMDVYLPDTGWTGYDPTIGEPVSQKHIALGVSAHPRGVMPVSGIFTGPRGAYQGMEVEVKVTPLNPEDAPTPPGPGTGYSILSAPLQAAFR